MKVFPTTNEINEDKFNTFKTVALNQLINEKVSTLYAAHKKLFIHPDELNKEITNIKSMYPDDATFEKNLKGSFDQWKQKLNTTLLEKKIINHINSNNLLIEESDLEAYYKKNKREFKTPETYVINYLLLNDKSKAEKILDALRNGYNFKKAIQRQKLEPSALKSIQLQSLSETPWQELSGQSKGAVSSLVKTKFGFQISQLAAIKKSKALSYADSKNKIKQILTSQLRLDYNSIMLKEMNVTMMVNQKLIDSIQFKKWRFK